MIYGYIRVSSDKQTVENQRFEINNFCEREKIKIDGWIEVLRHTINASWENCSDKYRKMTLSFVPSFHVLGEISL